MKLEKVCAKKFVEKTVLKQFCYKTHVVQKLLTKNHMCVFLNGSVILQNDAFGQKQMTTMYEKITSGTFCDTDRADWKY